MIPVFNVKKRKNWSLEETISNSLSNICVVFEINYFKLNHKEIIEHAEEILDAQKFKVFKILADDKICKILKSIHVLRKLNKINELDRPDYLKGLGINNEGIYYLLDYVNPMIDSSGSNNNGESIGYYQDWSICAIEKYI